MLVSSKFIYFFLERESPSSVLMQGSTLNFSKSESRAQGGPRMQTLNLPRKPQHHRALCYCYTITAGQSFITDWMALTVLGNTRQMFCRNINSLYYNGLVLVS